MLMLSATNQRWRWQLRPILISSGGRPKWSQVTAPERLYRCYFWI